MGLREGSDYWLAFIETALICKGSRPCTTLSSLPKKMIHVNKRLVKATLRLPKNE